MPTLAALEALQFPAFVGICLLQVLPYFIFIHPYLQMLLSASLTVYIGCLRNVRQKETEAMSSKDAYMFPVIGSGVLFSLYILIKFISKEYLNMLLGLYFYGIGVIVVHGTVHPFAAMVMPSKWSKNIVFDIKFQIPFKKGEDGKVDVKLTVCDIVCLALGTVIGAVYLKTKNWVLNNMFGVMFSIQGIEYLSLGNIKIGIILLSGLFVYDVFWVFGTDVMVTVAKGFEAPIKLLFPKAVVVAGVKTEFSMVGLGDIVIPGIYVALLLRFDNSRSASSIVYFLWCFGGYVLGLIATIAVMHVFQAAQPALLYLVPACIGTSLLPALLRGDLKALFAYTEEKPAQPDDTNTNTDNKNTTKDTKDSHNKPNQKKRD
eukprot:c15047_g1_i1.p1 GENE.c15047_g1_i1~~c15047_g1_i1.p1  ORF type:complete len:396 (-),score=150.40 c15047_g1_i1:138-1259(-)